MELEQDPADRQGPADGEAGRLRLDGSGQDRVFRSLAAKLLPGPNYLHWLDLIHRSARPRTYLEIGIASGGSLSRVAPTTHVIGIDPAFSITHTIQAPARLFRETSDRFFERRDPAALFGKPIDLAFIDGLHTFDQTFRDIVNVARYCDRDSVVLVHDVLPVHQLVAERNRVTNFWTGDVWKIAPMIAQLLPAVEMITLLAPPSGLMVLRNVAGSEPERAAWRDLEGVMMRKPFPATRKDLAALVNARQLGEADLMDWIGVTGPN